MREQHINDIAQFTGCIDSWGNCAKKSFEIFEMASKKIKLDDLGYESLKSICELVLRKLPSLRATMLFRVYDMCE